MDQGFSLLGGMGLGAGLMYLLDPNLGRRRRALLRDQLVRATSRTEDYLDATWNDVRNRAQGLAAETAALWKDEPADDRVLIERVRSRIGRYVSHPRAIEVSTRNGRVTLIGPILAREADGLLGPVALVPAARG